MLFEHILSLYYFLCSFSWLTGLILMIALFFMKRPERSLAFIAGIFMSFIGCIWISPIDLGAWGFGIFEYIFAIPFWFSIGFMIGQQIFYWSSENETRKLPKSSVVLAFYIVTMILTYGYAFKAEDASHTAIRDFVAGKISESELKNQGHLKNSNFDEIAISSLSLQHIANETPEAQIRFLANRGINIYHCRHTPVDLIEALLTSYESPQTNFLGPLAGLIDFLCKNPNLRTEDFTRLVKRNVMGLKWKMLESPTLDEERLKILRDELLPMLQDASSPDSESVDSKKEIIRFLKRLDEAMERKKKN